MDHIIISSGKDRWTEQAMDKGAIEGATDRYEQQEQVRQDEGIF